MKSKPMKSPSLALALMAIALHAEAQNPANARPATAGGPPPSLTDPANARIAASPEFKAFLDSYTGAINARDPEKLRACIHPKSLELMAKDKTLSEQFYGRRFGTPIPPKHDVIVTTISADATLPFAEFGVVFPTRPTNQVQISFNTAPNSQSGVIAFLRMEGGKWYEVVPSPPAKK